MRAGLTRGCTLSGRTVAITGSTGGLGSALAAALIERKARLVLLDLDADAVAAQTARLGDTARGWAVDVRDFDGLQAAMRAGAEHFGGLDVVIAGAGVAEPFGPLAQVDPEDWERALDINLSGVWRTFKVALPYVQERRGHLLAIASMASFVHTPLHGCYAASKAGVWALCNALRVELRHLGVTVGSVHPSFFPTPMVDWARSQPDVTKMFNNFEGLFKLTSLEAVVKDVVRGIERRSAHVVSPRKLGVAAIAPGMMQAYADRAGFKDETVREAIALGR